MANTKRKAKVEGSPKHSKQQKKNSRKLISCLLTLGGVSIGIGGCTLNVNFTNNINHTPPAATERL